MSSVHYFYQDVDFKLPSPSKSTEWIKKVIKLEKKRLDDINYVFCSDGYLFKLNEEYLGHKTLTDIITFDLSDDSGHLAGEIYISIERVRENAAKLKLRFDHELHRVIIHGVLHLAGHKDKTARQKQLMRKREDTYLSLR